MQRFSRSLRHALRGLAHVWKGELNFRIQLFCAVFVIAIMVWYGFTYIEVAFVLLAMIMVLAGEVFNTLLEDILDVIEPGHHTTVGKLKDMMAGVVLVLAGGALTIGIIVALHHFTPVL